MSSTVETTTERTEAFSDGVFAVAITLLVLDVKVPSPDSLVHGDLSQALIKQWPTILACILSFLYILIGWINHHKIFSFFRKVDGAFLIMNGYLLLTFVAFPFTASLLATYIQTPQARTATAVYAGVNVLIAIGFKLIWNYASHHHRLIREDVPHSVIRALTIQYNATLPVFLVAFALAFVAPIASLILSALVVAYYMITGFTFPNLE